MFGELNIYKSVPRRIETKKRNQFDNFDQNGTDKIKKGIIKKEEFFRSTKRQGNMEKYLRQSRKETSIQKNILNHFPYNYCYSA